MNKFFRSFTFRLTLWYALIFCLSAWVAFAVFYFLIDAEIEKRTDEALRRQVDEIERIYQLQGIDAAVSIARIQAEAAGEKRAFFRMFYRTGVVFASANLSRWNRTAMNRAAIRALLAGKRHFLETQRLEDNSGTVLVRVIYRRLGREIVLQWGLCLEQEQALLASFRRVFIAVMAFVLASALAVGGFMARRAMSGVERIGRTARRITENDLDARVPVGRRADEIDELAITINQMLDRIQSLVSNIRRMNDSIAHDLRSPITRIRGLAEITLARADRMRPERKREVLEDFVRMAEDTIQECDRLLEMISTMLTISRTESGIDPPERRPVDLARMVERACELFLPVAEDGGIELRFESAGDEFVVRGDERMLQRMVANLLDNALKYTPPGGKVVVSLDEKTPEMVVLSVTDTGYGIEACHLPHIFERFYRGDQSRGSIGAGLGLSLALAVAKAHGGRIEVESAPGKGSTFRVLLPRA